MNEKIKTTKLYISVYDSIVVSEGVVVELIVEKITTWNVLGENGIVVSIEECCQEKTKWLYPSKDVSKSSMISFEEFKKSLGTFANELSDEEIDNIRHAFNRIADIAFDRWAAQKNTT